MASYTPEICVNEIQLVSDFYISVNNDRVSQFNVERDEHKVEEGEMVHL